MQRGLPVLPNPEGEKRPLKSGALPDFSAGFTGHNSGDPGETFLFPFEFMTRRFFASVTIAPIVGLATAHVLRAYTGHRLALPATAYTLYRGERIRDRSDVRNYVATFDGRARETTSHLAACSNVQRLLQDRTRSPLGYWCEVGGYQP